MNQITPTANGANEGASPLGPIRQWILTHDERLSFAAAYVILAVGLSLFVSLFWLLVLVAVHVYLEWLKKRYCGYAGRGHAAIWTLWDTKLDLALAMLAFVLAAYAGVSFGVAGAQSAGRAGVLASRLGPLTRGFAAARVILFRLWFAARIIIIRKADMARAAARGKLAQQQGPGTEMGSIPQVPPWKTEWTKGDWIALIFIIFNIILLVINPFITDQTLVGMFQSFREQLHPWPSS
ncbi:MAG: hypothetical protein ACLFU6_12185 [Candidatus Hydrogenedentota bacterium]